jgi:hypothetical protein
MVVLAVALCARGADLAGGAAPLGVPDDAAVAKAAQMIKHTLAAEYLAATTMPGRAALAQRLLREAIDTRDDVVSRYALLCEARDLAAKSAESSTACRAIELLSQAYGVSAAEMTLAALMTANRVALTPASQESLALCAIAAADRAAGRDEYELAGRLAALGEAAAAKAKRIVLLTDAQDKVKEIAWAAREYAQAKGALEALANKPDDAAAKSAAGRYRCLVKNDWERGLPLLMDGTDAKYKELAERDQAAATADAAVQAEVADQWWALGETHLGRARLACRTRAAHWYKLAGPGLSGLPKTLADKRLDELDANRLREQRLAPGLLAEVFKDAQFQAAFDRRVDPAPAGDWPASGERAGVPKDDFSIRWTGQLRAPASGKYTLALLVNEGARIYIDEKMVLEEAKGSQKRKPTQATITLSEGMHAQRIEYWDTGGAAKFHLSWQPPGAKEETPIPAKAFVHEMTPGR